MRGLLAIVLLAAFGWSGYWWIGSTAYKSALDGWLTSQKDAGWQAERVSLQVVGYPNRFDTLVTGLNLASPDGSWSWRAPEFQILSLSYKPNHIIAAWPGTQRITTRDGSFEITGERIRGSVIFAANTRLTLDRSTLELLDARLANSDGPVFSVSKGILSTRRSEAPQAPEFDYDLGVDFEQVRLSRKFAAAIGLGDALPQQIERILATGILRFDGPWDRTALASPPRFLGVEISNVSIEWGEVLIGASGNIYVTRQGFADGRLALTVANWRTLVAALGQIGVIDAKSSQSLVSGLGLIAGLGGDPKTLRVPLEFKGNRTFLGPVDIGPAPRLIQR